MVRSRAVRLGVLGPSEGELAALACAALHLVDVAKVDRVVYLGADDALDRVVAAWARELVGSDPSDELLFVRATRACVNAAPAEVEAFVQAERARRRLRLFATVPPPPGRTIELFDGKIAVLLFDKASLEEDDIAGAALLVFGRSTEPLIHRVGPRVFLSPGPIGPSSGVLVLDDEGGGISAELVDAQGGLRRSERIERVALTGVKMRVQGAS